MTYTIRLVANAQRDIAEIEKYYDENVPQETERCIEAVQAALDWIVHHAHQPPVSRFGLRRVSTETFRYYVWYRVFDHEQFVQVVAVLHHRRGDDALVERMP